MSVLHVYNFEVWFQAVSSKQFWAVACNLVSHVGAVWGSLHTYCQHETDRQTDRLWSDWQYSL